MKKITDEECLRIPGKIKHKTNLLYLLARCCDLLIWSIQDDFYHTTDKLRLSGEVKLRFSQYSNIIRKAQIHFENFIEPTIIESGAGNNFRDYEESREFSNELMRLLMLYYETCVSNIKNHEKVFDLLCSFEDRKGIFTAEDINKFDLGCKE